MKSGASRLLWVLILLGGFAPPSPPAPIAGSWTVGRTFLSCKLQYRSDDPDPVTLTVEQADGTRGLDVKWDEASRASRPPLAPGLFIEPGHVPVEGFDSSAFDAHAIRLRKIDLGFLDRLVSATSLRLEDGGALIREIPVAQAAGAVAGFRQCVEDALRAADIDPVAFATLRRPPKAIGGVAQWISNRDYPKDALRKRASGPVQARLTVGTNGRVTRCKIVRTSGNEDLDAQTCILLEDRGRYEPAIGPRGRRVIAPVIIWVLWALEE